MLIAQRDSETCKNYTNKSYITVEKWR